VGRAISAEDWVKFRNLREAGLSRAAASKKVGISLRAAGAHENGETSTRQSQVAGTAAELIAVSLSAPIPRDELSKEALRALEDFGYFRKRYLGRDTKPWQEEAAKIILQLLETDLREWTVINVPPGSGKSTTFTHDIPAWLIARDRGERILIGSRTQRQATMYGRRLRATLQRTRPVEGADAALSTDFGSFQPPDKNLWRAEEFIVWAAADEEPTDEKEPTVMCAGMDTGFLGGRFRFVIWDDLVDASTIRTEEARSKQREWFDDEAETRLEPGGLFVLQGQRLSPDDLYRYVLDKPGVDEHGEPLEEVSKYRHVIFPAHADAACEGLHARTDPAWPEGCLLDPQRLSWRDLQTVKTNNPRRFRIIMQQEDVDPAGALIPREFIYGGEHHGATYRGCLDYERSLSEVPLELDPAGAVSVITVDPSPTKWWAIQWWAADATDVEGRRYLLDAHREVMDAPQFLDRLTDGRFVGLLPDMVATALERGLPIQSVIVEQNAAQRFMLQYDYVQQFMNLHAISIVPHSTTQLNKADDSFGVQALRPLYQFGRVRLPYGDLVTKNTIDQMAHELTTWPSGRTDDTVMAQWFFEWNLPNMQAAVAAVPRRTGIPSWVRRKVS
jgi:hypothetical protein